MRVRYDTRDEKGETRRERNDRHADDGVEVQSPDLNIPECGQHIWDWYFDISDRLQRNKDGICTPIPPSEFTAWVAASRQIVYPTEYAILGDMDLAYCGEMNKELEAFREREKERIAREARNR